jgi:hypothetical protein
MKFTAATLGAVSMAFALIVDHLMDHLFLPSFVPAISGWRFHPYGEWAAQVRLTQDGRGFSVADAAELISLKILLNQVV